MSRSFVILSLSVLWITACFGRDYYVATDGNDVNPGTIDEPFATPEKARDTIRQSKARARDTGGLTVYLRYGKYFRTQPFTLASEEALHMELHFVDEQALNLALKDDSPAYSLPGFQRIPFESIGPRR
jgi:hypothetical protein